MSQIKKLASIFKKGANSDSYSSENESERKHNLAKSVKFNPFSQHEYSDSDASFQADPNYTP